MYKASPKMDDDSIRKYDFVVFENWHLAINHQKDVSLIADLLKSCGYSVAIADVYPEAKSVQVGVIPHIEFGRRCIFLPYHYSGFWGMWPFLRVIGLVNRIREGRHLRYVMKSLQGRYDHLYCGSYYVKMPIGWLRQIPSRTSAFFWGLRSSRLNQHKQQPFRLESLFSYRLRRVFDTHPNLKFFVSDELIKSEFLRAGIASNRLVIRPERFIADFSLPKESCSEIFSLLSIGSIRPQKRVERIIEAVKSINDQSICYTIAGSASANYETVIKKEIGEEIIMISRLNLRLSEEKFNNLIEAADFLILCDKQQASNVTNGTMNEALLAGVPIIAPNYNPYRYYIEKYKVGILFDPDDLSSLVKAICQAKTLGRFSFARAIHDYQTLFLKDNIVKSFSESMKLSLSTNNE